MSDNYLRDAIGRFTDHVRSEPDEALPAHVTNVEQSLHEALARHESTPSAEAAQDVVKFATARFIELASEKFGRAQTIHYYFHDGKPVADFFRTRGFRQFSFDPNAGDYPHENPTTIGDLEALADAINIAGTDTVELRIPEEITIIDRAENHWPREVGQHDIDADYDHTPVTHGDDECVICGYAVTSDQRRHGFDA